ncbi:hypothetical protein SDC9_04205 [bioreactor metagenome]|uniref:Uncharacterized protein n=1 Tax=bioreactor metagenome TaxID=1076179 RepID=A0A644SVM3_9ZZZZ|nr:hypothetical protein [Negativicutes bacterium]
MVSNTNIIINTDLVETFIINLASVPLKKKHLFIASFLAVKNDNNSEMSALIPYVEAKYKELIVAKEGTYKEKSFKNILGKLSYTLYSYRHQNNDDKFRRLDYGFSHETIFELYTDKHDHLEGASATEIIDNNYVPTHFMADAIKNGKYIPDHRELYGSGLLIRVAEPFYGILKTHENKYDYEKCLDFCKKASST